MNHCNEVGPGGVCSTSTLREASYSSCLPPNRCRCPCHTLQLPLTPAPVVIVADIFDTCFNCTWLLAAITNVCSCYYPCRCNLHYFYSCLTILSPLSLSLDTFVAVFALHSCYHCWVHSCIWLLLSLLTFFLVVVAALSSHCYCCLCMSSTTSAAPNPPCFLCMKLAATEVSAVN